MFSKTIAAGVIALTALTAVPANAGGVPLDLVRVNPHPGTVE